MSWQDGKRATIHVEWHGCVDVVDAVRWELLSNGKLLQVMDVDGVFDFQNDYYKVGDYNPFQKLNKKQIVLRTINQRSYETEKFYTDKGLIKVCSANG